MMSNEKAALSSDEDVASDTEYQVYCSLCKTGFSGTLPYRQHLKGNRHKKAETKQFMKEKYGEKYLEALEKLKGSDSGSTANPSPIVENVDGTDVEVYTCHICKKVCTGYVPYQLHLNSRQHAKQLKRQQLIGELKEEHHVPQEASNGENALYNIVPQLKPFAYCNTCKKSFSGPEGYSQHLTSSSHSKEIQKLELLKGLEQNGVERGEKDEEDVFTCTICEKVCSGPIPYQHHLLSDVHKSKAADLQLIEMVKDKMTLDEEGVIHCNECKKPFSGPKPFHQHIMGPAHSKQKKKDDLSKDLMTQFPELLKDSAKVDEQSDDSDSDAEFLVCTICHKCFSGPESARDHFRSKKHEKAKKEKLRIEKIKQGKKSQSSNLSRYL